MVEIEEKRAVFVDNIGKVHVALLRINPELFVDIRTYSDENEPTGYMRLWFHPNNRIFLDTVYCYDKYRSRGIASKISDLADFLLQEYIGYVIRGVYEPKQLSTDRKNNIYRDQQELNLRASEFYKKCGYQIVSLKDFLDEPYLYPELNKLDDFQLGEKLADFIVEKKIIPMEKYQFCEMDEIYVHNNALGIINSDSISNSFKK